MSHKEVSEWYNSLQQEHPGLLKAVQELGKEVRKTGPLDEKTAHLIQLAGAAAQKSEGSVHSHARRAMEAGASADEVRHTLILLTSTIGFPTMSAALSWAEDIIE